MPRQNCNIEGLIREPCKIRKRGCLSSSSSSTVMQSYRFKRALLVGKRGGSNTPVPTWKMGSRSVTSAMRIFESSNYQPSESRAKGNRAPVSVRKLAATLWEMSDFPSPRMKEDTEEEKSKKEIRRRGGDKTGRSIQAGYLPPHLSNPSHSPASERIDCSGTNRRSSAISQRLWLTDHNMGGFKSTSNANLMEIEKRSRGLIPTGSIVGVKNRLKDLNNCLITSKKLLKILGQNWDLENQYSSSVSLVSALRVELEKAHVQVGQLIQEQRSDHNEVNYLKKRFTEERVAWKSMERERIQAAVKLISRDLGIQMKQRRQTESLNKTLSRELAESKATLSKVIKNLENEKRSREIMEHLCDELARSIGEDRAAVEELKKESAKVREEMEKEREMLQLADVLREERVQMKLSEAKYQFEEKNAAVDKLRNELEAFMGTKMSKESQGGSHNHGIKEEVGAHLSKTNVLNQSEENGEDVGEIEDGEECNDVDPEEDSAESDLHSIELNMDNNNRSYMWNYATIAALEFLKRVSVEEEINGRKSTCEKIPRRSIYLERQISDGIEWDFSTENFPNWGDGYDLGGFSEIDKQAHGQDF